MEQELIDFVQGPIVITGPFPAQEIRLMGHLSFNLELQGVTVAQIKSLNKNDIYQTLTNQYYGNSNKLGSLKNIPSKWHNPIFPKPLYNQYNIVDAIQALADPSQTRLREWTLGVISVGRGFLMAIRDLKTGKYHVSFVLFVK